MPAKAGGDESAPTPGMLGRGALASCLAVGYATWAARLEVPIASLSVEVEADFDGRGELGVSDLVPPGLHRGSLRGRDGEPAPAATVDALIALADRHSPYLDVFGARTRFAAEPRVTAPQREQGLTRDGPATAAPRPALRLGQGSAVYEAGPLARGSSHPRRPALLACWPRSPGDRVLDVACGTGLSSIPRRRAVGAAGRRARHRYFGRDGRAAREESSQHGRAWIREPARRCAATRRHCPVRTRAFDAAVCALGLMYVPFPLQALREMRRCSGRAGARWRRCGVPGAIAAAGRDLPDRRRARRVGGLPDVFSARHQATRSRGASRRRASSTSTLDRLRTTLRVRLRRRRVGAVFRGGPVALAYSASTRRRGRPCTPSISSSSRATRPAVATRCRASSWSPPPEFRFPRLNPRASEEKP